ncbi:MAG: arginine N-succinyltransferase [Hellea sp.]|nr:arginine N-succinyltransferase [Hellea sp.]
MLVVRPAAKPDLKSLINLAQKAGPGFTSLAVGHEKLEARLHKSIKSFTGGAKLSPDHVYLLMIEDEKGHVVGMSAVKAQIGVRDPFFNFRIMNVAQKSTVTNRRFDMEVLMMVNEYSGATEVGSLYVLPEMRGTGAGRLISQARYMLMAADKSRFHNQVISELRGHVDEQGYAPFWEAVGRKFFHMDFAEADHISAEQDSQFILDLMPRYPIYAALLPKEAREVMGKTHPAGIAARKFLEREGFRYNGLIDIFDGGPSVSAPLEDIRTVHDSRILPAKAGKTDPDLFALLSNDRIADFRSINANIGFDDEHVCLDRQNLKALKIKENDKVRFLVRR